TLSRTAPGRRMPQRAPAARAAPESATTTAPRHSRSTSAACPSTRAGRRTTHSATSMRRSSTSRACNRAFCWSRGRWSASRQDGASRAQINVIDGTVDGNGNSLGVWVDASHTQGAMTQSFGAFRIDPNLAWGNQLISSDVQGGYYRVDYRSRRWLADFGVDQVRSVSGNGSN